VVPGLVEFEENITGSPEHTGLPEAETEIETGKLGFTIIVTLLLVAGLFVVHDSLEFITQETRSLFAGT
jgi:hypothetical protein